MVPVWTETPPTRRPFSTTITELPSLAACTAARRPAGPLPMTTKSNRFIGTAHDAGSLRPFPRRPRPAAPIRAPRPPPPVRCRLPRRHPADAHADARTVPRRLEVQQFVD